MSPNDKSLPFSPEPVESLRARYPRALETLFDPESFRPPENPANVFDFLTGYRLVVRREDGPGLCPLLHLSATVDHLDPDFARPLTETLVCGGSNLVTKTFRAEVVYLFRQISRNDGPLEFLGFSVSNRTAHWCQLERSVAEDSVDWGIKIDPDP